MLLITVMLSCIFVMFNVLGRSNDKYIYWSLVAIAALASGTRVNVGLDFPVYLDFFQGGVPVSGVEPFFLLLARTLSLLDSTGRLGFLLCSFVTVFGYAFFLSRLVYKHRFFCFHLFLTIPVFYINSFNLIRQHMAIALSLTGLVMLFNNNKVKSVFYIAASVLTHSAAAVLLPLVLPIKRYEKYWLAILPLLALFAAITLINFEKTLLLNSKYGYYLDHSSSNSQFFLGGFGLAAFFIAAFILFRRNISHRVLIFVGNISTAFFITVWLYSDLGNFWLRIAQIFFIFVVVGFAVSVGTVKGIIVRKIIFVVVSGLLLLAFLFKFFQDPTFGYN